MSVVSLESRLVRKAAVDWMHPRQLRAMSCETTAEWRLFLRAAFEAGVRWTLRRAKASALRPETLAHAGRSWVAADMTNYRGRDLNELVFQTWVRGYQFALSVLEDEHKPFLPTAAPSGKTR